MKYAMQPWTVKKDAAWADVNPGIDPAKATAASADTSQFSAQRDYDRHEANLRKNVFDVHFQHVKLTPANDPAPARRQCSLQKAFDNHGAKFLGAFLTRIGVYQ